MSRIKIGSMSYIGGALKGVCVKKPHSIHNHPPDNVALEIAKTLGEIKVRATLTEEATSSVIQNCA